MQDIAEVLNCVIKPYIGSVPAAAITTAYLNQYYSKTIVEVLVKRGGLTKKADATKSENLYRVQLGAYANKENAEALAKELKVKGYPVYITKA